MTDYMDWFFMDDVIIYPCPNLRADLANFGYPKNSGTTK